MYTPTLQTENMTQVYQTEIRTERCNELSFVYCLGLVNQMRSWTSSPATSRSASCTIIPSSWSSTVYSKCLAACKTQNQVVFKHYLQSNFVFYEIEILISVLRIWNSNFSQDPDLHAFQIGLFFLPFIHCCNWTWVVGRNFGLWSILQASIDAVMSELSCHLFQQRLIQYTYLTFNFLGRNFLESSTMADLCAVFGAEGKYRQRQKVKKD